MAIKPNQRCLIIGAPSGEEANIGALVTVREYQRFGTLRGQPHMRWTWDSASRPLKVCHPVVGFTANFFITDGVIELDDGITLREFRHGLKNEHLMPIDDAGIDALLRIEKMMSGPVPVSFNCRCLPAPVVVA